MKSKPSKSLTVALHAMDGRSRKTMMMFLQTTCKGIAQVVSEQEADIDMIDIDLMGAQASLEHCLSRVPLRPIIVLSLQPTDIENTIFMQKPAKVENMIAAFQAARLVLAQQKKVAKIKSHHDNMATKAQSLLKPDLRADTAVAVSDNGLKVALYGMDEQTYRALTNFLHNKLQDVVQIVTEHEAEVDILDADLMGAKTSLEHCLARKPARPIIIISQEKLNIEGTIYVNSPVKVDGMLAALQKAVPSKFNSDNQKTSAIDVESETESKLVTAPSHSDFVFGLKKPLPVESVTSTAVGNLRKQEQSNIEKSFTRQTEPALDKKPKPSTKNVAKHKIVQKQIADTLVAAEAKKESLHEVTELAAETKVYVQSVEQKKVAKHQAAMQINEQGFSGFIGLVEGVDFNDPKQWVSANYNPKHYYQGYVQSTVKIAYEKTIAVKLSSAWKPLIFLPRSHEILLDADDKQLRAFAGVNVASMPISTTKIMSIAPVNIAHESIATDLEKFQDLNTFLWKLACWTSKGRYIAALDLKHPVYLKQWPNFTRLVITPHAMRIAALLMTEPRTIPDIVQVLKIKPQYVFIFVSAAYTIGILEQINSQDKIDEMAKPVKPVKKKAQKKGLLKRILNKLRG